MLRRLALAAILVAAVLPCPADDSTDRLSPAEAEAIITRAYEDILHREPDPQGMQSFTDFLVEQGKTEDWLRQALAQSPEAQRKRRRLIQRVGVSALLVALCAGVIAAAVWAIFKLTKRRPARIVLVNITTALVGVAAVVAFFEWDLRNSYGPHQFFNAGVENPDFRSGAEEIPKLFTDDPDTGFRPFCGPSHAYSQYGTLDNTYALEKREGATRLLFIGDSVTHRGQIVAALREAHGEDDFEYWNAGVEAFNLVQEVAFYRKFNRHVDPDHVILTVTFNDLETTPLAFRSNGKLMLVAPLLPHSEINPFLFRHSYLYRQRVGRKVRRNQARFKERIRNDMIESLRSLKEELDREEIRFTVLVLPALVDLEASHVQVLARRHEELLSIVSGARVRYFDLAVPVARGLRDGVPVGETEWDRCHPSPELSRVIAEYLAEQGLLKNDAT